MVGDCADRSRWIEQRRRDFKAAEPELYAYIVDHEIGRALDSAGDAVSGTLDGQHAANVLWSRSANARRRAQIARGE